MHEFLVLALVLGAIVAAAVALRARRSYRAPASPEPVADPARRSWAMADLKERRIRAIQAEIARSYPDLRSLSVAEQERAVRHCEAAPFVTVFDAQIKALRKAERGGTD